MGLKDVGSNPSFLIMSNQVMLKYRNAKGFKYIYYIVNKNKKNMKSINLLKSIGLVSTFEYINNKVKMHFTYFRRGLVFSTIRVFKKKNLQFYMKKKVINKITTNAYTTLILSNADKGLHVVTNRNNQGGHLVAIVHN